MSSEEAEFWARRAAIVHRWHLELAADAKCDARRQPFDRLKRHMLGLMEGDVALMQQLVTLRGRIDLLRSEQQHHQNAAAMPLSNLCASGVSDFELTDDEIENDDAGTENGCGSTVPPSEGSVENNAISSGPITRTPVGQTITQITVNDSLPRHFNKLQLRPNEVGQSANFDADQMANEQRLSRRYFSRQNSVLRIPIAPSKRRSPGARGLCMQNRRTVDFSIMEHEHTHNLTATSTGTTRSWSSTCSGASTTNSSSSSTSPRSTELGVDKKEVQGRLPNGRQVRRRPVSALVHLSDASVDSGFGVGHNVGGSDGADESFEVFV